MRGRSNGEVFLIDSFEVHIAVEPVPHESRNPLGEQVEHGTTRRRVLADNLAHLRREVCFSKNNKLAGPFRFLRYQTREGAILDPITSGVNEVDSYEMGRYTDTGKGYVYQFTPEPGKSYWLEFDLLKGFDRGQRQAHFHLPQPSRMRQVVLTLDLSEYVRAGFIVSQEPALYLHTQEPPSHDFCAMRGRGSLVPAVSECRGPLWTWEISNSQGGVIDVCWDLIAPDDFIEVFGHAEKEGLDRMVDQALEVLDSLRYFYLIGRECLNKEKEGVFSLGAMVDKLPDFRQPHETKETAKKRLGRDLDRVSELFKKYFDRHWREYVSQTADGGVMDPEQELWQIFSRGRKRKPSICYPVGNWAWLLTKRFLDDRREFIQDQIKEIS